MFDSWKYFLKKYGECYWLFWKTKLNQLRGALTIFFVCKEFALWTMSKDAASYERLWWYKHKKRETRANQSPWFCTEKTEKKNELVYQIWLNLMVKRYHIELREASFWKVIRSNGQNSLGHFLVHVTSKWAFLVLGGCKCLTGWLVHFLSQLGNVKKEHGIACHGQSSTKFVLLNEKITTYLS